MKEKAKYLIMSKVIVTTMSVRIITNKDTYTLIVPEDLLEDELSFNIQAQFFDEK